jgi:hypothetical protein
MPPYYRKHERIRQIQQTRELSADEYKYMWQRSKEYTSTGISRLHFGHFKASCTNNKLCSQDNWFINLTLLTGYNLKRWQKGIDVMIPKKANSIRVDKLRTIVLMEPDFNFFNKLIGKWVMSNAEQANSIAQEHLLTTQ